MNFREASIILALSIYCFQALVLPARASFRRAGRSEEETWLLGGMTRGQSSSGRFDVGSSRDSAEEHGRQNAFDDVTREYHARVLDASDWKTPYIESYSPDGGNQNMDSWLNALLSAYQTDKFSHPAHEIPFVKRLLDLNQRRSEKLLEAQLSVIFERINTLDLKQRDPIQDASTVDFILALGSITDANIRVNRKLDPFTVKLQEYIKPKLTQLEKKLASSGRNDILKLINSLKGLWGDRR
ncbi:hypothetical protein VP01_1923g5 [Puccinia sorghi]|uniref:Uncharacterized protein n=1 Tax=Puccinia sorghi TaxID=27349 RepID=A0A0L6VCK1_9BASI|nr:hypothetical protein VP01_1923g5 [Puccinia sorghi]